MGPHAMARTIVREILTKTGITATAGIGSNMYLAKVAMDIVAKHMPADKDGVRVAALYAMSYRRQLWIIVRSPIFGGVGAAMPRSSSMPD